MRRELKMSHFCHGTHFVRVFVAVEEFRGHFASKREEAKKIEASRGDDHGTVCPSYVSHPFLDLLLGHDPKYEFILWVKIAYYGFWRLQCGCRVC